MTQLNSNIKHETEPFNMQRETARFNMIEQQIRTWEVLDPKVLQLLNDVPRENFVPPEYIGLAFADIEIPIGTNVSSDVSAGQKMLSPKLEGRILQALNVQNTNTVLHIGTGSGYFTALLASLAQHVVSIEIDVNLSAQAAQKLAVQHIKNVTLQAGDVTQILPNNQFFDLIVYTASSPVEPIGVRQQLNIGGTLFIVLGSGQAMQATLIKRLSATGFKQDVLFETSIAELVNAPQSPKFEF